MMIRTVTALARSLQPQARRSALRALIHVGDKIPNVEFREGIPSKKINTQISRCVCFCTQEEESLGE